MDLAAAPTHVRDRSTRGRSMDNTSAALLAGVLVVQVAHALTFLAFREPLLASNLLQECTPLLCAALCLHKGKAVRTRRQGRLWMQLSGVYFSWAAAQLFYLATVFIHNTPDMHAISDALWLAFALPILLVTAAPSASLRGDPVALLDTAQACLLFGLLFVLVYPRPGIIKPPLAYDVENLAVLFAAGLRYSVSPSGDERAFYRNIIAFMGVYTLCSLFAYQARVHGLEPGTAIDLCWSLPFTAFCVMAVAGQRVRPRMEQWAGRRLALPAHLHGISAVGMVVMSLAGSVVLSHYSVKAGILTLTASFLVFAGRTSVREWQLHSAHSQLSHSAFHDPLTGLGNRAMLREELSKRLENLQPGAERSTGLLFIDLDRFKTINDGFGHAFGDLLLVRVAALLSSVTRPQDLVARHGGDEFVVLLDQVDEEEARRLAQLIADSIRNPLELEGRIVHVTASIGIALSSSGSTADAMLQDADCAMYKAKSLGKDRAQFFAPDMLSAVKRQVDLETDLREALASRAIEVHYQPIYALPDNKLQGFEALARWCHPRKGMVSPGRFIPVAEETGLIIELGKQVLRRACQDCQRWNQHFGTRLTVAVNVSALQFAHRGLTDEIEEALNDAQLDPHLLKLEITESVLLSSYQAVEKVLTRARSLGIGVCLDDFGTGYSSLSYLLSFPFDVVKIDRSFVRHLDRDHRRAEMVRMVVQLALTLKKKVIAEGVETQEELAQLSAFGCDMVQGFLFSLPLPLAAVEALLSVEARTADGGRTPLQTEPAPAALASQAPEVSQVAGKMSLMASSLTAGL